MIKTLATVAILAASAQTVFAETITLNTPMEAASLHTGGIDMVVYYLDNDEHFEVVASYLDDTSAQPTRFQMALSNGDAVNFGLPGQTDVSYGFARNGDAVTVDADYISREIALAR